MNIKIGEADVRELLELISPDVSRHDWIRVGNALKHKTDIDGFALWSEWSKRSKQPSPRLEYEWRMLGGGQPCSLATLIYLARAENGAAVDQILARSNSQELDRTTEALQYEQVLIWRRHVAFIETTLSYLYTWPGVGKELISKDAGISNIMKDKSTLSLSDYLAHPDCLRWRAAPTGNRSSTSI